MPKTTLDQLSNREHEKSESRRGGGRVIFQVIDDTGQPVRPLALKDTVNVPMKKTVRLLVTFDERPGEWMFHWHSPDHADGGLMGTVLVGDVQPSAHVHSKKP